MKCAIPSCLHAAATTIQMKGEIRDVCAGHHWIWTHKIDIAEDTTRCRICREPLDNKACRGLCKKDYARASAAHALDLVALPPQPGKTRKAASEQIAATLTTTPTPAAKTEEAPKDVPVAEIDITISEAANVDEMSPAELVSALPWLDLTRIAATLRNHHLPDRVVVSQLSHLVTTHYAPELPEYTVNLIASLVLEVA